jgi:curved DNA-binding protein CbpA
MAAEPQRDAYRILQVVPVAHPDVIRASYYALARIHRPEGDEADAERMADLNWAFDQVRDGTRRNAYDRARAALEPPPAKLGVPLGPGATEGWRSIAPPAPPGETPPDVVGPFTRARPDPQGEGQRIDFGRYVGWSIRDLAHQDPTYLRWLSRHSSGIRFRAEILRYLSAEPQDATPAHNPVRTPARLEK